MARPPPPSDGKLRLAQQSRDPHGASYFFMCDGVMMTIRIAPRGGPGDPDDWVVEVKAGAGANEVVVAEWAATPNVALREAGHTWGESPRTQGLPRFDWRGVTDALNDVRALETRPTHG